MAERIAAPRNGPMMATPAPYAPPSGMEGAERVGMAPGAPLVDSGGVATHQSPYEPQRVQGPPLQSDQPKDRNAGYDSAQDRPGAPLASYAPNSAGPSPATTNAGGQNYLRDLLIQQMGQQENPSVDDPTIKAQLDPYRAENTRAMREEIRAGAESGFAQGQDYGAPERVAAAERAGNKTGLLASDLVGRELTARRDQIRQAMTQYGSTLDADQRRALEEKLATIDASLKGRGLDISEKQGDRQFDLGGRELDLKRYLGDKDFDLQKEDFGIRREGLAQTGRLGGRELDIREKTGMGGLNIDLIKTLLQNGQFNKNFGLDVAKTEAELNRDALIQGMG